MPEFPEYITGVSTQILPTAPVRYQPLNLSGMIQSIRQRPQSNSKKPGKPSAKDFEIEGRIGAVNQYMRPIKSKIGEMQNLVKLYGSAAYDMPQYSSIMTDLSDLTNDQRKNIVARETEMRETYKANTKDKGAYYDLSNWRQLGQLKTVADMNKMAEYAETNDLGYPQTREAFMKGFDENPTIYGIEEARVAVDGLFNQIGHWENGQGLSVIEEKFLKNMKGALTTHNTEMSRTNHDRGNDLDAAKRQSLARALGGAIDVTDPIVSGYLQGFLQKNRGFDGVKDYFEEDGSISENFYKDFSQFMKDDIEEHYSKRQIDVFNKDQTMNFEEQREYLYKKGDDLERMKRLQGAFMQQTQTSDAVQNLGIPMDNIFVDGYEPELIDIILQSDNTPFVVNQDGEGNNYLKANPTGWNAETLRNDLLDKYKDTYDPKELKRRVDGVIDYMNAKYEKVYTDVNKGVGALGYTTQKYDEYTLRSDAIASEFPEFYDAVNSDYLVGKTATEIGTNTHIKIGDTYMGATELSNARYEGGVGALKLTQNVIPTNMGLDLGDGKKILFSSPEWLKMSPENKKKISKQAKIALFDHDGSIGSAASKQGKLMPMDEVTQALVLTAHKNGNLNAPYYSPAAHTMNVSYSYGSEKEAAKDLQNLTFNVEVPVRYNQSNTLFKKTYDDVNWDPASNYFSRGSISLSKRGRENRISNGEHVAKHYNMDLSKNSTKDFVKWWNQSKDSGAFSKYSRTQIKEAIATAKVGGFKKGWKFSKYTKKVPIKASNGGSLHPEYKTAVEWRKGTIGKGDDKENRFLFTVEQDVTGATMGASNGSADDLRVNDFYDMNNKMFVDNYVKKHGLGDNSSTGQTFSELGF